MQMVGSLCCGIKDGEGTGLSDWFVVFEPHLQNITLPPRPPPCPHTSLNPIAMQGNEAPREVAAGPALPVESGERGREGAVAVSIAEPVGAEMARNVV